jgi:hypothetical protein
MSNKVKAWAFTALSGALGGAIVAVCSGTFLEPYAQTIAAAAVGLVAGALHFTKPGDTKPADVVQAVVSGVLPPHVLSDATK